MRVLVVGWKSREREWENSLRFFGYDAKI